MSAAPDDLAGLVDSLRASAASAAAYSNVPITDDHEYQAADALESLQRQLAEGQSRTFRLRRRAGASR